MSDRKDVVYRAILAHRDKMVNIYTLADIVWDAMEAYREEPNEPGDLAPETRQ